ncbi:CAP domain-containing protein [Pseudogemmobacter faecipullorum]|uniref:SCP domain-containing protein n=1 Tax=Pseudogemmobacter faecipullorum TaxID=2755041 RepID=A0ABS8CPY5_9RHOB|nr:CAP domain-containing protein [Pseudogemmobacter faecipullorum]MCB5411453.1 hypothetical protein [Pseudogemmobacter faecipullorum]
MHSVKLVAISAGLALAMTSAALSCTRPDGAIAQEFAGWLNGLRAKHGLQPLRMDAALTRAAGAHVCDMSENDFLGHKGSGGSTLKSRLKKTGYRLSAATENVARSSRAPAAATVAGLWENSDGHLANLLNPAITEMGLAVATEAGMTWYVFVGARPR